MGEIRIKRDVSDAIVYGIHIDPNIQDPSNAVTYLEDAVGMTPASMGSTTFNSGSWADAFFIPKPCMVRYDGTVDYYLDPSDYSKKADGTASDIADPNYAGNAMMEWGLIWFKFEPGETDGEGYFYVSNKKVDDTFNCWCNYDANNNITPHFYTAIYNGTGVDKLRSISGVQLTPENGSGNITVQKEISRALANNTSGMTEWYIDLWADRILLTGLLYLMGKSLDLQTVFGKGLVSGGQSVKESYVTGTLNNKGLFWGTTATGRDAVKVFGMENLWGCCWHRIAGLFGTADGYAYKLTHGTVDGSTATEFGTNASGYIPVTATQPENGLVSHMSFGKYGMLPSKTEGTTSTYYCDYFWRGLHFAMAGGASYLGDNAGEYIYLSASIESKYWYMGSCLSLKPRAKILYNPDWDNRPAHKFTNGEWIDIPTHKYTNNRWQGELTSQSALKFRADGEMLDWRVEGKTSGNLVESFRNTEYTEQYKICLLSKLNIKPSTSYTVSFIMEEGVKAYFNEYIFAFKNFTGTGQRQVFNITTKADINKNTSTWTDEYGWILCKNMVNNEKSCNFREVMILEGTYTSETIPPYEPYGGVGDWDETEQKYRLPVRVEGENLFDINGEHISDSRLGITCFVVDNDKLVVQIISPGGTTRISYPNDFYNPSTYTVSVKLTGELTGIRLLSTSPFSGGTYNTTYRAYWKAMTLNDGIYTTTFSPTETTTIGFVVMGADDARNPGTVENIRVYEGTYTASTLPPYEVNLYTDHQLMDGDSIDYAIDQTTIPIATGNNVLTVDTAVKPKSVFVKFEG